MTRPTLTCKLPQPVAIVVDPTVEIDEYADIYFVLQVGRINLADINRHTTRSRRVSSNDGIRKRPE